MDLWHPATQLDPLQAYAQLADFARRRGPAPLTLAMHAAVPQGFRLDLLHLLKLNFVPVAATDTAVEADVILADICQDIGGGYFEFDPEIRRLLLDSLVDNYQHEPVSRVWRVANFLLWYVHQFDLSPYSAYSPLWKDYLEIQRWVAMGFMEPEQAAYQLAAALDQAETTANVAVRVKLGGLASILSTPLVKHDRLLRYAVGLQALESGQIAQAQALLNSLGDQAITVGDITLRSAAAILSEWQAAPPAVPPPVIETEAEPIPKIRSEQEPTEDQDAPVDARVLSTFWTRLSVNLGRLEERRAKFGADVPLKLLNQIEDYRQAMVWVEEAREQALPARRLQAQLETLDLDIEFDLTRTRYKNLFADYTRAEDILEALHRNLAALREYQAQYAISDMPLELENRAYDYVQAIAQVKQAIAHNATLDEVKSLLVWRNYSLSPFVEQAETKAPLAPAPPIQNVISQLQRDPTRQFPTRPLSQIDRIVIHHTAVPPTIGVERIAAHRVEQQGWPGIGYHYYITGDGQIQQTNELTTQSSHAGEYDPVAVGIAFAGDFTNAVPSPAQLEAGAQLIAWLLSQLNLSIGAVFGYKELVNTASPGAQWDSGARWGDQLRQRVQAYLAELASPGPPLAVVELRLEVTVPPQVSWAEPFELTVVIRPAASPQLVEGELTQEYIEVKALWPEGQPAIQLRLEVSAPACDILGEASQVVRLAANQDPLAANFRLTPRQIGQTDILVTVYQDDLMLGSVRVNTAAVSAWGYDLEQPAHDAADFASLLSQEYGVPSNEMAAELRHQLDEHYSVLEKLQKEAAMFGTRAEAPARLLKEIDAEEQTIAKIEEQLAELERTAAPTKTGQGPPRPAIEWVGSPNFNRRPRPDDITAITIHATANSSLKQVIDWFNNPNARVSAHYTIGKDGTIVQHVRDSDRAWHAGQSEWKGRAHCNDFCLGIELVNLNDGIDPYPPAQHEANVALCAYLCDTYNIRVDDIMGHADIALPPGRKSDPRNYDVERLRREVQARAQRWS